MARIFHGTKLPLLTKSSEAEPVRQPPKPTTAGPT
jgi:hypothetical protein